MNAPTEASLTAKTVEETATTLTLFLQPEHSNSLGTVHGGVVLKLCDECGGIVARRHARRPAVTVTVVYVALDDNRHPVRVPRLQLLTDEERRRFNEGKLRQAARLAQRKNGNGST